MHVIKMIIGGVVVTVSLVVIGCKTIGDTVYYKFCKRVLKKEDLSNSDNYNEYTDRMSH